MKTIEDQMAAASKLEPVIFNESGYTPTRLEYFAAKALQGLITGRSEKDRRSAVRDALSMALDMCDACDKAQD